MLDKYEFFMKNEFNPYREDTYIPLLEEGIKKYFKVKNAIAVSSGTSAIHIALAALNIKRGDEVIVPSTAVIMSIVPVLYVGAVPIFVDCQKNNVDFDYNDLERKITNRCKAIIPVYMWGCSYDLNKLKDVSERFHLHIIEDACQAHGSKWENKFLGTFGTFGCFSMKNGKLLSCGEGGFLLTNNDDLANRCRLLRNHCIYMQDTEKSFSELGWNYRLTEMQAYVALMNLKELNRKIEKRVTQTEYIYTRLKTIQNVKIYEYYKKETSNKFSPVILCKNDKQGISIAKRLSERGIINSTGTFGLIPANRRKVILNYCKNIDRELGLVTENSDQLLRRIIAISLTENFEKKDLENIVDNIIQEFS